MTIDLSEYVSGEGPKYLAIARALAEAVRQGVLQPGTRLPTHRDLAEDLGVSVQTVSRAYEQAEKNGLVQARVGSGTWIRDVESDAENQYLRPPTTSSQDHLIDLSIAHPVCLPSHHLRFRQTLAELADAAHAEIISECRPIAGLPYQRERASAWLTEQLNVPGTMEDRVLCNGAAHGLMLALASVVKPGDVVLCERLTDHGLISLARTLGFQLYGIGIDEEGAVPEALELAIQRFKPSAVCLTPTQLNPTGATMSNQRRDEIADILQRHDLWLIEDDVHALLEPPGLIPLTARLPLQSFHVTSLTKVTVPGLRAGYLTVPRGQMHHTLPRLRGTSWMATPLVLEVADYWLATGMLDTVAHEQRQLLAERHAIASALLAGIPFSSRPNSLHIWLEVPEPWQPQELQQQAQAEGIAITTAQPFVVDPSDVPRRVRLSLGAESDLTRMKRGLETIVKLLSNPPPPMLQIVY